MIETIVGKRLQLVISLDRQKEIAGLKFGPDDLTYPESLLLELLCEERRKYQDEVMEQAANARQRNPHTG